MLPGLRWIFASIAPPEDYFTRLGVLSISFAEMGAGGALKFRHKYVGKHVAGLLASKPVPQGVPSYSANFQISLIFLVNGKSVLEKKINTVVGPWWSLSEAGFTLFDYDVPNGMPIDQDIECVIRIVVADPDFERLYGPVSVFVRKEFEK